MAQNEKGYWYDKDPKHAPKYIPAGPYPTGAVVNGVRGGTGKDGNKHYYRGKEWTGHTGFLGSAPPPNTPSTENA
jgi:hypothetical protein